MSLAITYKHPSELRGYERNARTHSKEQVAQIAASIQEFGFNNPILIDADGQVIAGHGRLAAATELGLDQVPCVRLEHLTEEQRRAYILADNKLALNAGWDRKILALELGDLKGIIDLGLLGFSSAELLELLPLSPADGSTDPNDVPDVPKQAAGKLGQVWQLGRHRLMCGDSTATSDWGVLLAGEKMQWVWTDPPYNVNYGDKAKQLNKAQKGHGNTDKILNDNMDTGKFYTFLLAMFSAVHASMVDGGGYMSPTPRQKGQILRGRSSTPGLNCHPTLFGKKTNWSSAVPTGNTFMNLSCMDGSLERLTTGQVEEKTPRLLIFYHRLLK